ncbi:MAG: hypothetical protein KAS22_10860, partial [Candidatus Heimdallarchaeota archaeon]|nr:hypothetical protein [Candidatus Heimdallarchaeota archaeon]
LVFFLRSNRFTYFLSFVLALGVSCVLIFVVASKYIIVTWVTGIIIISTMTITLSFFIYIPTKYFTKKN